MKRWTLWTLIVCLLLCLTACGRKAEVSPAESKAVPAAELLQEEKKLKMIVDGQTVAITLYNTPAASALYKQLPLELNFEDFNRTEKIAYLTQKLVTAGEPDGCEPKSGDLCYYAPWGNLSVFYKDFRYSNNLIRLGRIDSGMELLTKHNGKFSVKLEAVN